MITKFDEIIMYKWFFMVGVIKKFMIHENIMLYLFKFHMTESLSACTMFRLYVVVQALQQLLALYARKL